jgi:hypothetical protein
VVLDDLCIFQELFLLLSSTAFALQKGGRELTENVSILSHKDAGFDIFLFVTNRLYLVFLHMNQRIITYERSIV